MKKLTRVLNLWYSQLITFKLRLNFRFICIFLPGNGSIYLQDFVMWFKENLMLKFHQWVHEPYLSPVVFHSYSNRTYIAEVPFSLNVKLCEDGKRQMEYFSFVISYIVTDRRNHSIKLNLQNKIKNSFCWFTNAARNKVWPLFGITI